MHPALRITLRHFLVQDAAARRHPLHIAGTHLALVAQAIAVLNRTGQHVSNGFNPAVRMPRKSGQIIFRIVVAKIVQQQKRIEILRFAETVRRARASLQRPP